MFGLRDVDVEWQFGRIPYSSSIPEDRLAVVAAVIIGVAALVSAIVLPEMSAFAIVFAGFSVFLFGCHAMFVRFANRCTVIDSQRCVLCLYNNEHIKFEDVVAVRLGTKVIRAFVEDSDHYTVRRFTIGLVTKAEPSPLVIRYDDDVSRACSVASRLAKLLSVPIEDHRHGVESPKPTCAA